MWVYESLGGGRDTYREEKTNEAHTSCTKVKKQEYEPLKKSTFVASHCFLPCCYSRECQRLRRSPATGRRRATQFATHDPFSPHDAPIPTKLRGCG